MFIRIKTMYQLLLSTLVIKATTGYEEHWEDQAKKLLTWNKPFTEVYNGSFGNDSWFYDGEVNSCYNCIDRWANENPNKIAIIYEHITGESQKYTYAESLNEILKISYVLQQYGLKKGDCVSIYMPSSPMAIFFMLACARLGYVHNVVFGGFSAESLRSRLQDSSSKLLIAQDHAIHDKKTVTYIEKVIEATEGLETPVLVYDIVDSLTIPEEKRNLYSNTATDNFYGKNNVYRWTGIQKEMKRIEPAETTAEDRLFYLYTSGSTGTPKGMIHTTGGYLVYAAYTMKTVFDVESSDVFCCTADIGWITGHTYSVYGPLAHGITTVILQGTPLGRPARLWEVIEKYKVTHLYTAPTVIRALKVLCNQTGLNLDNYDVSSLKALGSVGEPLNEEAREFYSKSFNGIQVIDTYFQTETGGIIIASEKKQNALNGNSTIVPLFGIDTETLEREDSLDSSEVIGKLYISKSWPGIARGILNDKSRFERSYFGNGLYYTGDECKMIANNEFIILGRADDVINISGHRISTVEVERVVYSHENTAEAAVVSMPHKIKGQCMVIFVVPKSDVENFGNEITRLIEFSIGGFCRPERVIIAPGIIKTATGKLLRHALRRLLIGEAVDEITLPTCINPEYIAKIKKSIDSRN